ncbi:hypothetical protein GY45DRAFT_494756 [Cubamyces sp. BRFM 1775]|nr:hypothetical protein GY45DRAFT_494756 [Cubamyces sp. BRFM 1775]
MPTLPHVLSPGRQGPPLTLTVRTPQTIHPSLIPPRPTTLTSFRALTALAIVPVVLVHLCPTLFAAARARLAFSSCIRHTRCPRRRTLRHVSYVPLRSCNHCPSSFLRPLPVVDVCVLDPHFPLLILGFLPVLLSVSAIWRGCNCRKRDQVRCSLLKQMTGRWRRFLMDREASPGCFRELLWRIFATIDFSSTHVKMSIYLHTCLRGIWHRC